MHIFPKSGHIVTYARPVCQTSTLFLQVEPLAILFACKPMMYVWLIVVILNIKNTKYSNTTHSRDGKIKHEI